MRKMVIRSVQEARDAALEILAQTKNFPYRAEEAARERAEIQTPHDEPQPQQQPEVPRS